MYEPIEEYQKNGFTVKIYQDPDAESPGNWDDTEVFIVTTKNREFEVIPEGYNIEEIAEHLETHKRYNGFKVYPLYAYVHSGVGLSLGRDGYPFNCPWDSGQIGFVLVKWKGNHNHYDMAESVVKVWNQYLSGDVYCYSIKDESGEVVDSCGGFYGLEYAKQQAEEAVGWLTKDKVTQLCTDSSNMGIH